MLNERVLEMLNGQGVWWLATCSDEPHNVPVGFKEVSADGKLVIANVFMKTTLENIKNNGKVAISVMGDRMVAYTIKGSAEYVTEGELVEKYKVVADKMFKGNFPAQGVLVITPEKVFELTPGPNNNREV